VSFLDQLQSLVADPPPAHAFELSGGGVAFAHRAAAAGPETGFRPFGAPVLQISPMRENVVDAEAFSAHIASLVPAQGSSNKRRDAALILPDYCARIALLDFDSFPKDPVEQTALVRFRMKRTVPFEMDSAAVSFEARRGETKNTEVLVAAAAAEIVSRYEAPFRAAGFQPGFVTTSMLATLDLLPKDGLQMVAKLSGAVLTVAVCAGRLPKLVRCVEIERLNAQEVMAVLYPTLAYAEDELKQRPQRLLTCGFDALEQWDREQCEQECGLRFEPLSTPWGAAGGHNAGLLGWLTAQQERN
jgi:type IV pilus assembly protein PilM